MIISHKLFTLPSSTQDVVEVVKLLNPVQISQEKMAALLPDQTPETTELQAVRALFCVSQETIAQCFSRDVHSDTFQAFKTFQL